MALLKYYVHPWIKDRADCLTHEVDPSDLPADVRAAAGRVKREDLDRSFNERQQGAS
jgi:hypothetical protein